MHYDIHSSKIVCSHKVKIEEICQNAPILGHLKGCGYNLRATFIGAGTVDSQSKKIFQKSLARIFSSNLDEFLGRVEGKFPNHRVNDVLDTRSLILLVSRPPLPL